MRVLLNSVGSSAILITLSLCMTVSSAIAGSTAPGDYEIHGHRGARWWRPENTLSAMKYAVDHGADALEMDLHATKDNVLVLSHDHTLNPDFCLDSNRNPVRPGILIRSLTLQELKTYDCGHANPAFPNQSGQKNERIPTFEEVLTWLDQDPNPRAREVRLNVETKSEAAHPEYNLEPKPFVELILVSVERHHLGHRFILESFDYRTFVEARKIDPQIQISMLVQIWPWTWEFWNRRQYLVQLAQEYRATIISPEHTMLDANDVQSLHAMGVQVIPWTVNSEKDWQHLNDIGVDAIITDNPSGLYAYRAAQRTGFLPATQKFSDQARQGILQARQALFSLIK